MVAPNVEVVCKQSNTKGGVVYIHTADQVYTGRLRKDYRNKERPISCCLAIDVTSPNGTMTCKPGDSGALVTSEPLIESGTPSVEIVGIVSGIETLWLSSNVKTLIIVSPISHPGI